MTMHAIALSQLANDNALRVEHRVLEGGDLSGTEERGRSAGATRPPWAGAGVTRLPWSHRPPRAEALTSPAQNSQSDSASMAMSTHRKSRPSMGGRQAPMQSPEGGGAGLPHVPLVGGREGQRRQEFLKGATGRPSEAEEFLTGATGRPPAGATATARQRRGAARSAPREREELISPAGRESIAEGSDWVTPPSANRAQLDLSHYLKSGRVVTGLTEVDKS